MFENVFVLGDLDFKENFSQETKKYRTQIVDGEAIIKSGHKEFRFDIVMIDNLAKVNLENAIVVARKKNGSGRYKKYGDNCWFFLINPYQKITNRDIKEFIDTFFIHYHREIESGRLFHAK